MHGSDGLDGIVKSVASLSAVTQDLVVLDPAPSALGIVLLLARQQGPARAFAVRDHQAGVMYALSPSTVTSSQTVARPESRQAFASAVVPGTGRATAMTNLLSVSMMTCTSPTTGSCARTLRSSGHGPG